MFVCLFFFLRARLSELIILSADDWLSTFVLIAVYIRYTIQGAPG